MEPNNLQPESIKTVERKVQINKSHIEFLKQMHGQEVSVTFIIDKLLWAYRDVMKEPLDNLHKKVVLSADEAIREST